ncbi:UNVERIFIED_CONTAM: Cadherin-23 [Gekko kuhli]
MLSSKKITMRMIKGTELNDDRSPSNATVMTTFNILVIDINDNAPEFNSSEYSVAIPELAQVGFALPLFIQVQDKDEVKREYNHHTEWLEQTWCNVETGFNSRC